MCKFYGSCLPTRSCFSRREGNSARFIKTGGIKQEIARDMILFVLNCVEITNILNIVKLEIFLVQMHENMVLVCFHK